MSSLFEYALRAKLPFIAVHSDDPLNFKAVLQSIAGRKVQPLPSSKVSTVGELYVYTTDIKEVSAENYHRLAEGNTSCVILNPKPEEKTPLVFDAGLLPTPPELIEQYLKHFVSKGQLPSLLQALNGLSLKTSQEVVQLTMARTQTCTVQGIRGTRLMLGEATPGLHYLDTDADFYVMPKAVEEWLGLNSKYFLNPNTPPRLMPRGLLFVGVPGVGKTMAAQAIARHWKVPLFRLDVASGLTRWLGESEKQFQANLMALEQNAPCVALLDELEKLFVMGDDSPTMPRILSQLLWWLQTHKSPIITIMTSNDISRVPPELYRPGRIDKVVTLEKMTLTEAKSFATGVFKSILKTAPTLKQQKSMRDAIDDLSRSMAHAEVVDLVSEMIKERNWIEEVTSIDKAVS